MNSNSTMTTTQQIANDINADCPLVQAPELTDDAWDCVAGRETKEYFSRSPYATIVAYERGFVVHNLVTGGQHPCPTWAKALAVRGALADRYVTITNSRY